MRIRAQDQRLFAALLVSIIAFAWLSLWVWGQSPFGRYLDHQALDEIVTEDLALLAVFVAGWTVMVFAMMLPTSLPLIFLFRRLTRERPAHAWLMTLLITGYIGIWAIFGILVHAGDLALHQAVERVAWVDTNPWVIGAGVLALAGGYQFTSLKYHCLDKCRSPMMFIAGHWTGKHEWRQSFRLGIDHGLFCLGCCWSLMLLMFAVGAGSIGWMLLLGLVMAVEKNFPWGKRIGKPLGAVLLLTSLGTIVTSLAL